MAKSGAYWKKRFEILEEASNAYGQDAFRKIEPAFEQAQREIEKEINAWYGRFAKNNQVTIEEARKLLTASELKELKWDIKEYIKYGHENDMNQLWMKQLENASSKYHISRLEALKLRTQQAAEVAFGNELDEIDSMARKVIGENYYHSIYEVQKGFNLGWEVGQIDERKLEKLISKPWAADGKNFSDRIWEQKSQLVNELHTQLTRTCVLGKAPDDAIKAISKKFNVTKGQAGRLVMTEQAYFHSVSQKEAFEELDVEEYEIVATLDSHTSAVCQEMDGKHFPMKDYQPGVTAPPFHVWCRSVTVPYFDDEFSLGERAARDVETGETYYVPSDMTYKDWKKSQDELYGAGTVDKRHKMVYNISADKMQFERYKSFEFVDFPISFKEFQKLKYDKPELWESFKSHARSKNYLQQQLSYSWNGEKCFIPKHTKFEKIVTIAGKGADEDIHCIDRLIKDYKGTVAEEWEKRAGKVVSDKYIFDVHWYEYDSVQYEVKLKNRKEQK